MPAFTNKRQHGNQFKINEVKKACPFCTNPKLAIDYKDEVLLNQFISGQAKIKKTKRTGVCAKHQRVLAKAIKRARILAILPAASVHNYFNTEEKRVEKEKRGKDAYAMLKAAV